MVPILVNVFSYERGGWGYFSSEITVDFYPIGAAFSGGFTTHYVSDQHGVKELYAAQDVYIHPHSNHGMNKRI